MLQQLAGTLRVTADRLLLPLTALAQLGFAGCLQHSRLCCCPPCHLAAQLCHSQRAAAQSTDQLPASPQVSEAKKKRAAAKKEKVAKVTGQATPSDNNSVNGDAPENGHTNGHEEPDEVAELASGVDGVEISDRACTGVLTSHPASRDIHLESFSLLFHGHELLADCDLELNYGRQAPLQPALIASSTLLWRPQPP